MALLLDCTDGRYSMFPFLGELHVHASVLGSGVEGELTFRCAGFNVLNGRKVLSDGVARYKFAAASILSRICTITLGAQTITLSFPAHFVEPCFEIVALTMNSGYCS